MTSFRLGTTIHVVSELIGVFFTYFQGSTKAIKIPRLINFVICLIVASVSTFFEDSCSLATRTIRFVRMAYSCPSVPVIVICCLSDPLTVRNFVFTFLCHDENQCDEDE